MVHLFFVESYFHLLVADQIIRSKSISLSSCYFVTERGVVLPDCYQDHLIYDGSTTSLLGRIKQYYSMRKEWKRLFGKEEICTYWPFQYYFPTKRFFSKYVFYEEGFSAYSNRTFPTNPPSRKRGIIKELIVFSLLPFAGANIRGIISGITCDSIRPFATSLIRLSDDAYNSMNDIKDVLVETIKIDNKYHFSMSTIQSSFIVVLDRLTARGRPFNDSIYLSVLQKALKKCYPTSTKMLVKLHPADYKNKQASDRIINCLSDYSPVIINDNLENLAICNNHNTFLGTNSTILYYAPILGSNNRSISFARLLSEKDNQYREFLQNWGGTESFCTLFGRQVECL